MYQVKIDAEMFDRVFYRAFCMIPSKNEDELLTAFEVSKKLKAVSEPIPQTPEEMDEGKAQIRELVDDDVTLLFDQAEYKLVKNRLKESIPMFTSWAIDVLYATVEAVNNAEKVEVKAVESEEE